MKRILCLIACITLALPHNLTAGQHLFRMLDTSSGLPDNNVRNMTMLPNGLMCIQTSSMLNLYDGASCRSYKYNAIEIPYTEYNGLNNAFYDSSEDLLWCTTRDKIWIFNFKTREFEYDITERLSKLGIHDNKGIRGLYIDSLGRYWIITLDAKVRIFDKTGNMKQSPLPDGMSLPVEMQEHDGHMWMISMNGKIAQYDPELGNFRTLKNIPVKNPAGASSRMELDITSSGKIWIMYDKDLILYDIHTEEFKNIQALALDSKDLYTTISLDNNDNLWIGSARSGISILSKETGRITNLPYLELTDGKKVYHHTDIAKIYVDDRDGVWVATQSEGLLYWHKDIIRLGAINNESLRKDDMNDESVKCMVEDSDGTILVGTIHGLLRYDPLTNEMTIPFRRLKDELCISLYKDRKDRIWVGTFYNGAFCIDKGRIRQYKYEDTSVEFSYHESTPNFNCVRSFHEDKEGNFWISVYGGVGLFDPETGDISLLRDRHPEVERFMIVRDICSRPDGKMLISGENGRFIYSPSDDTVETDPESEDCHAQTNQAIVDNRMLLWIATAEGLRVTDLGNNTIYYINEQNGLPAGNIMSVEADDFGNIWAASFSYISRIRPMSDSQGRYTFSITTYGKSDGVESGAFFQKSSIRHSNGHIYFGGAHGICDIIPLDTYQDVSDVMPLITSINAGDRRLETWGDRIVLSHDESFLTFEFSNLNYANPSHTVYMYRLENFDKEWRRSSSQGPGTAQYTYLTPGTYKFQIKAANNDTDWSEVAEVDIVIRPPFYKSATAYVIYALLVMLAATLFVRWQISQTRRKIAENKEKERLKQREKLDQMKFKFFTNISHELRTPLSLIILPLESVMKEMEGSPLMPKLQTMHNNASHLLSLVNHLLDFRKLEMGGERLNLKSGNISEFIQGILISFKDAAQKSNIMLSIEDTIEKPMMVFDDTQMQKIVNNLLSNALKFTPEGGFINVKLSQTTDKVMILEVSDTGIGIPKKDIANIFDRFYRSGNTELRTGSGIGLSLVKQYAEMHSGSISVSSEEGKGSTFTLRIPMNLAAEVIEETVAVEATGTETIVEQPSEIQKDDRRHIMVVDDNPDFREYLVGELSDIYEVTSAADGRQCIDMLKTVNPEIIICDVMMPHMDGFEVVKAIKSNIETSHIPVILLSARTSEDIRLEGYETGADAYLTKPFKLDILLARVKNLIDERKRRIESFSQGVEISPAEVTITTIDQKLMTRIMQSIEKNMDNADYSVEELSSDVGMHRMNLYRKLQSIAGMTPSEFIRTVRLKRAAQLLKSDPNLTVAEVSDMVGFNTQKYFSKYFKEMFGMTPSQFR